MLLSLRQDVFISASDLSDTIVQPGDMYFMGRITLSGSNFFIIRLFFQNITETKGKVLHWCKTKDDEILPIAMIAVLPMTSRSKTLSI